MSTAPEYEPRSTVGDYRQWAGRWELWNGFAVAVTPSPCGRHAKAAGPIEIRICDGYGLPVVVGGLVSRSA